MLFYALEFVWLYIVLIFMLRLHGFKQWLPKLCPRDVEGMGRQEQERVNVYVLSHSRISLVTNVRVVSIWNKIRLCRIVLEWIAVWRFLIANKMWFYILGISSYHYSCTSMVISIALLSATQWNLIKLNYSFIIWIDENNSGVYNYVITHSRRLT